MKPQNVRSCLQSIVSRLLFLAGMSAALTVHLDAQTILIDSVGDASGYHDTVAITGGFTRSNLYLTATFSSGTLNRTNLGFIFGLDIDQNPSTGVGGTTTFFPLGAEFSIGFFSAFSLSEARLVDAVLRQLVATLPVSFGSNTLALTVPLSLLHNDDGLMNFGFIVGVPTGPDNFTPYDVVPDSAHGGPLGGPTSVVPELKIQQVAGSVVVRWPVAATNYVLEAAKSLSLPVSWEVVTNAAAIVDGEYSVSDSTIEAMKLYRLKR